MAIPYSADQAPTSKSGGFDKFLDGVHRVIVGVDRAINRVIPEEFNPFYYLGGITNLLWVILVPTGIFLWFYYQATEAKAFQSVAYLTSQVFFGNVIRALHRYSGDGMFVMAILHMLRNYFTDRYRGFRDVPWVSGVLLLVFTGFIGLTGYLLVWDQRALVISDALVKMLQSLDLIVAGMGTGLAQFLLGGNQVNNLTLPRMFFLHAGLSVFMFFGLWVHYVRLHRPKIWPPMFVNLLTIGVVVLAAGLWPVERTQSANVPLAQGATLPLDVFFLWPVQWLSFFSPGVLVSLLSLVTAGLLIVPWLPRKQHRYVNAATVTPENCTGCQLCAVDCPFDAIVMVPGSNPNPRYKELAVVNEDKCAECGICVGACPFHAINLPLADEKMISDKVVALLQ